MTKHSLVLISGIFVSAGFLIFGYPVAALIFLLFVAFFIFLMSICIRANFFLDSVTRSPDQQVILSFDDGPHPKHTPQILEVLRRNNVRALFFLIGKNVENHPNLVRQILDEGHQIGGHSYNHKWSFGFIGLKKLEPEIVSAQNLLSKVTGEDVMYFRPPFGVTNPNIARIVNKHQLISVGWNARSFDTIIFNRGCLKKRLKKQIGNGKIVLLHELPQTVEVLEEVLQHAHAKGYMFGVLHE